MALNFEDLKGKLFSDCVRDELEILIKGLKSLHDSELSDNEKQYQDMCLSTLEAQLKIRYSQFDK